MMRRSVAVALGALFVTIATVAPASAGKTSDVVAATLPPGSKVAPAGHWYLVDAAPGAVVTQNVRVSNPNKHPITTVLEAVDATTSDATGVAYGTSGSPKALTSRWVVVSAPQVTLAAGETRDIPFTVRVPAGAKPGEYLAAVSASVPLADADVNGKQPGANQAALSMGVQYQRNIGVEVDVPGPRAPQLAVTGAEPKATPDGVVLGVHIANQGNAFAHGTGVVRVTDTNTDFSFSIDTFVPGTAITYPMLWTKTVVPGTHHVQVDLSYEGGKRTSWNGDIVIAGATQAQLENALRNVTPHAASSPFPWAIVAGVLALFLVGGAVVVRRRSRRPNYVKYRAA
jgi:hypothetical protein